MTDIILREPELLPLTGLPHSSRVRLQKQNLFPKPIPLGARAVGWRKSEIDAWVLARTEQRDKAIAKVAKIDADLPLPAKSIRRRRIAAE